MYVYEDIPMLIETIKKHQDDTISLLVDESIIDQDILFLQLFFSHHNFEVDLKLMFNTIVYLRDKQGYDRSLDDLYKLIGILAERLYVNGDDVFSLLENYMHMYLIKAYMSIFDKETVTLRDILELYGINIVPITNTDEQKKRLLEDK